MDLLNSSLLLPSSRPDMIAFLFRLHQVIGNKSPAEIDGSRHKIEICVDFYLNGILIHSVYFNGCFLRKPYKSTIT
jgi:hypothetical protein